MRVGFAQDMTLEIMRAYNEHDTIYATVKGNKPTYDLIIIKTTHEINVRKACKSLAAHLIE